jgi:hypothetical protein
MIRYLAHHLTYRNDAGVARQDVSERYHGDGDKIAVMMRNHLGKRIFPCRFDQYQAL